MKAKMTNLHCSILQFRIKTNLGHMRKLRLLIRPSLSVWLIGFVTFLILAVPFSGSSKNTQLKDTEITADSVYRVFAYEDWNISKRIKFFEDLIKDFPEKTDTLNYIVCNYALGLEYQFLKSESIAKKYYKIADRMDSIFIPRHSSFVIPTMKGHIQENLNNQKETTALYEIALKRTEKDTAVIFMNKAEKIPYSLYLHSIIAAEHLKAGNDKEAEKHYNLIYDYTIINNLDYSIPIALMNLCKFKDSPLAIEALYTIIPFLKNNKTIEIGNAYLQLSHHHKKLKKYKEAINLLDSAGFYFAKYCNCNNYVLKTKKEKIALYLEMGDKESAYKAEIKYLKLMKSVDEEKAEKVLIQLNNLFEEKNNENETLNLKASIASFENKKLQIKFFLTGALLLILVSAVIIVRTRSKIKKRRKLNKEKEENYLKEIKSKNRNLRDFAMDLNRKHEFTSRIMDQIKELKNSGYNDPRLNEMILDTSSQLEVDLKFKVLWEDVENLNYKFFDKLKKLYPEISKNYLHFCALFHMNLSDKEIASIKRVTYGSVRTAKYRIKKQLGVPEEENLNNWLTKL